MAAKTTQDQIAEFLARKGATKCPASTSFEGQATPLFRMRRQYETRLTTAEQVGDVDHEVIEREQATERRYLELQGTHS